MPLSTCWRGSTPSLTDSNRLFALFSTGKYANPVIGSLTPVSTSTLPTPYTDGRGVIEYSTTAQIHDSQIVSASLVNQFSASLSRMFIPLTSNTFGGNYPSKAGLKGLPGGVAGSGFPDITFSGGTNVPVSWGGTNSHAYNNFTGTIAQAVKPYPQYNGISDPWLDVGNSTYNALQISLTHRFAHGLSVMFNYAYSKELDDLVGVRDPNKDFLEKGPGTIDHPSVAGATVVYQLPFGKGHKLSAGALNPVVGNWQISALFTYQGGAPLSITGTYTGGGIIDASCYPNYAAGFSGSVWQNGTFGSNGANVNSTAYLNKAAFVDPANYTEGPTSVLSPPWPIRRASCSSAPDSRSRQTVKP